MKKLVIILVLVGVAAAAGYLLFMNKEAVPAGTLTKSERDELSKEVSTYTYTQKFEHEGGDFSFLYPAEFKVSDLPSGDGETIVVQKIEKNLGVQIVIVSFDGEEDIDITADDIHANVPGLKISDTQPVQIGPNRKGLAFVSDNPAFGGESREVWFVYNKKLYQISTYAYLDPLLKGMFATWQFQ